METNGLFMLISERLLLYPDQISLATYNALYEVMVENPCTQVLFKPHQEPTAATLIQNPGKHLEKFQFLKICKEICISNNDVLSFLPGNLKVSIVVVGGKF